MKPYELRETPNIARETKTSRDAARAPEALREFSLREPARRRQRGPPDATTTQDACKEYALKTDTKQSAWSGATHLQKRTSKHAQLQRRLTSTAR
jgi:hypothetical protein